MEEQDEEFHFIEACKRENVGLINSMIKDGINANACDKQGKSALMHACDNCHVNVVKLLLNQGASSDCSDGTGKTSLMIASRKGSEGIVNLLLNYTPLTVINAGNNILKTALMFACEYGHDKIVQFLIERGANIELKDRYGRTALMFASLKGFELIVALLLNNGAKVDVVDSFDRTSLIHACRKGKINVVRTLMKAGADCYTRDFKENTVLMYACKSRKAEIVDIILKESDSMTDIRKVDLEACLVMASGQGCDDIVILLINYLFVMGGITSQLKICETELAGNFDAYFLESEVCSSQSAENNLEQRLETVNNLNEGNTFKSSDTSSMLSNALLAACKKGNEKIVDILMTCGANDQMGKCRISDKTPFMFACELGHVEVVKLMLQKHVSYHCLDLDAVDFSGQTALMLSAKNGHAEIVKLLIQHGVDIDKDDLLGRTALMYSVIGNYEEILNILVVKCRNINGQDKEDRMTALGFACSHYGRDQMVEPLLKNGAHIWRGEKMPLLQVCMHGYEEIFDIMIENGVDFSKFCNPDSVFRKAFTLACRVGSANILRYFIDNLGIYFEDVEEMFTRQCYKGHFNVVDLMIERGVSVNARNEYGNTALIKACQGSNEKIVQLLIDKGVDLNEVSSAEGKSPLYSACEQGRGRIVQLLLNHEVEINLGMRNKRTPLMQACVKCYDRIAKLLINKGADVNARDNCNETALTMACAQGHQRVVELLLENGAIPDVKLLNGPLLSFAFKSNKEFILNLLITNGADINCVDDFGGKTALIQAVIKNNLKIAKWLIDNGANASAFDVAGKTALMYAIESEDPELANSVIEIDDKIKADQIYRNEIWWLACQHGGDNVLSFLVDYVADYCLKDKARKIIADCQQFRDGKLNLIKKQILKLFLSNLCDQKRTSFHQQPNIVLFDACRGGEKHAVDILVDLCDISFVDDEGKTALTVACEYGHKSIVKYLLQLQQSGDIINVVCNEGKTCLIHAMEHRSKTKWKPIAKLLIEHGVAVNVADKDGNTALMVACKKGCLKTVNLLLQFNANASFCNRNGESALSIACWSGSKNIVQELILNTDCTNVYDIMNRSFQNACKRGHVHLFDLLLKQGNVDINATDRFGSTALMLACQRGCVRVVSHLVRLGADLDIVHGRTGLTAFGFVLCGRFYNTDIFKLCVKLLHDCGRLMCNERLKLIHRVSIPTNSPLSMYFCIDIGIFEWELCHTNSMKLFENVLRRALKFSICPGYLRYKGDLVSPFILSLLEGNVKTMELIQECLYFFSEDVQYLNHYALENELEIGDDVLSFIKDFTIHGLSLFAWSFITVSKCLATAGAPNRRSQRVDALPIPDKIKRSLKFDKY